VTTGPAVIFDFDGVLADSESLHFLAFERTFASRGWAMSKAEYYERYLGYSDRDVFETFAREHRARLSAADLESLMASKGRAYADLIANGSLLYPGAERLVRSLADHFPLAIASGALFDEIVHVLDATGLRRCFGAIVGADDVASGKPSPAPYLEAARRIGAAPSACVGIEDSPWGLESARLAGLRTVGVTHTYPAERLTSADALVQSLDEISEDFVRKLLNSFVP
jgi:beta-phosphoglucomutase